MNKNQVLQVANENEIILDEASSSPPKIRWKVKNGTTVRKGEIIAEYTNDPLDKKDQGDNSHEGEALMSKIGRHDIDSTFSSTAAVSVENKNVVDVPSAKKKIKRPKKRNRSMMMMKMKNNYEKMNESTAENSNSSIVKQMDGDQSSKYSKTNDGGGRGEDKTATTMHMGGILESFQKKNILGSNERNDSSGTSRMQKSTKSIEPVSTTSSKIKWIPIQATMDGFIEMYISIKRCQSFNSSSNDEEDKEKFTIESVKSSKIIYVLGKIEPCTHPAIIDGLCAVCGAYVPDQKTNVRIQPQIQQSQNHKHAQSKTSILSSTNPQNKSTNKFTLSGGVTISISQDYANALSQNTSEALRSARKLNLVLDLDHTLLHATADRRATEQWRDGKNDDHTNDLHVVLLPFMEGHPLQKEMQKKQPNSHSGWQPHYVKLRPHLAQFISRVMESFEITIYTAGTRTYANKIADVISRHVLDYQSSKKKESKTTSNEDGYCLDEGELNELRQKVARLEERVEWDKSRKERQEYVKHMNEQFESLQKKEGKEKLDGENGSEGEKNLDDYNLKSTNVKVALKESDNNGNGSKSKPRRRRVMFSDEVIEKESLKKGDQDQISTKKDSAENEQNDLNQASIEELKARLKLAEERELDAQNIRKKIFGTRIISRTDLPDLGRDVKSLRRVFPCGGMMAAIVDDREDVWANAENNATGRNGEPPHNLLLVKPYHFTPFLNFADVNNGSGKDLSFQEKSVRKDDYEDEQLLWTADILERLHSRFYDNSKCEEERKRFNVPSILMKMRKEVLSQSNSPVKVLLSGLVPLHLQSIDPTDERVPRHDVIRYCQDLGAEVMTSISDQITHVIASKDGTDKILQARKVPGCAIVRISWLMECYWSIKRRDIEQHYLGHPPIPPAKKRESMKSNIMLLESDSEEDNEDEDHDEDDDLLLEFKKRMNEIQSRSN